MPAADASEQGNFDRLVYWALGFSFTSLDTRAIFIV
jgi:hypothetical protein